MAQRKLKKHNLMIVGASGGVANAVLHHLRDCRHLFGRLVLVDKNVRMLNDHYLDHSALDYTFVRKRIVLPRQERGYLKLLKKYRIDVVLDLTDLNSLPILEATNRAGVSYVNTALNDDVKTVSQLVFDVYPRKHSLSNAPHILCSGMNPGAVNMWVRYGIEKHGVPKSITHFEYDTSTPATQWRSLMTWSIREFLVEAVRDPSGVVLGKGKVKPLYPNALENREPMERILRPILPLPTYPSGFTVLHEENVSIGCKYDVPSKFLYAVNPRTAGYLIGQYEQHKKVFRNQLRMGDNLHEFLQGADLVGVMLTYADKRVYYLNRIPNDAVVGTNATYLQAAIGVLSALYTLAYDRIPNGVHFVEDLWDAHFRFFLFDNMRVSEFVFSKKKDKLKLDSYSPAIVLRRNDRFEHLYVV